MTCTERYRIYLKRERTEGEPLFCAFRAVSDAAMHLRDATLEIERYGVVEPVTLGVFGLAGVIAEVFADRINPLSGR